MSCGGEPRIGSCRGDGTAGDGLSPIRCTGDSGRRWRRSTNKKHQITVSKETVRRWMAKAGLWQAGRRRVERCMRGGRGGAAVANWCSGTPATHDWLEGRGEQILPDFDDRRCHQPAVCAFRAARLHGENMASVVGVPGAVRPAAGVLHG